MKAPTTILISDNIDFNVKSITRAQERHLIMTGGLSHRNTS